MEPRIEILPWRIANALEDRGIRTPEDLGRAVDGHDPLVDQMDLLTVLRVKAILRERLR